MKCVAILAGHAPSLLNFRGDLIRDLLNEGWRVCAVAPFSEFPDARTELQRLGVETRDVRAARVGTGIAQDLRTAYQYFTAIKDVRPDAVLAYTIKPVTYGLIAAWLARVPRRVGIVTGLGYAFSPSVLSASTVSKAGILRHVVFALYALSSRLASCILFQNADDQAFFAQKKLCPLAKSAVIPGSGINLRRFSASAPELVDGQPVRFLMIARLLIDKGVREYVAAASMLARRYPGQAVFELVGPLDANPESISIEEYRALEAGELDVTYSGALEDVRPAIARCHVYVLPSYREGTPRTVLEAMAMGRAIITTDAPGCRDTTIDGLNGKLVPTRNSEALASACEFFTHQRDLCIQMGRASRKRAEAVYDVHAVNRRIIDVLTEQGPI